MLVDQATQLEQIQCTEALWLGVVETFAEIGLCHAIYLTVGAEFDAPFMRSTIPGLYENYPPERDPFLRHSCTSYDILTLGAAYIDSHPYVSETERAFVERAAKAGLNAGLGIPVRLKGFDRFGGFIVGNGQDRDRFDADMLPRADELRLFCHLIHRRFEDLAAEAAMPLPTAFDDLSPREREIVLLLARGCSRQEAAEICDISVHTVSDYAKAAYRKLGVHNRAQAAAMLHAAPSNGRG